MAKSVQRKSGRTRKSHVSARRPPYSKEITTREKNASKRKGKTTRVKHQAVRGNPIR